MRFLNPFFLWFLPLALLPLLLNFILPLKPFKLLFSSVFLLRPVRDSRLKKVTAAKTLIVLLRCLAIFGLICAFSKPVADWRLPGPLAGLTAGTGRPLSLVILADRSLSMNAAFAGRSRRDFAAGAGAALLASLGPRDEAALVFFDSDTEVGGEWTSDFAGLSGKLANGAPGFRGTDYRKALEKAYAMLAARSPARRKVALLLSDGARNGFASLQNGPGVLAAYDPAVTLTGLAFPPVPNAWARGISVYEKGTFADLAVLAGGTKDFSSGGLSVNLYTPAFAGTAKTSAGLSGGGPAVFRLPPVDDPAGRAVVAVQDPLPQDDAVFFSLVRRKASACRVLVLYDGAQALKPGGGAYFLKRFFETESGAGGFTADFLELPAFDSGPGREYDAVIVFDGNTTTRQAVLMDEFVRSGGGALVVAGISGPPARPREALGALGFGGGEEFEGELRMDWPEPTGGFAGAGFAGFELRRVVTSRAVSFAPPARNFSPVWYFKDPSGSSHPALYHGRRGKGRVLVWTSSLSLSDTDLAAKPVFAPFVSASIRQLCGIQPPSLRGVSLGDAYEGSLGNTDNVKVAVTSPDGGITYVLARNGKFSYALTDRPGLYRWTAARETGSFAVNLDPDNGESSLEPENSPPWMRLSEEAPVEDFKSAVYGVEIGQFLLIMALTAFLAEFLLSRRIL